MKNYIEKILFEICDKLQLTPTLYQQADRRYRVIAETIRNNSVFNDIELNIYPQGSFRLKTTVKPIGEEEYDLDFVAELPVDSTMTPNTLYNHIASILSNDGIHNDMVQLKKRCVRVNYANDFHIDIMPGKLINKSTGEIIVPDRELKSWYHRSNPIGFAEWFENQARTQLLYEMNNFRDIKCSVEEVSEQELTARLEPLRRAVQLVKRFRDVYCLRKGIEPVRSIVICTLMGKITSFTGDTLDIIERFCQYVNNLISQSSPYPFVVMNPVVDEKLTEKWDEGSNYKDFVSMMKALSLYVKKLRVCSYNGDANKLIKEMFGETVTNSAITAYAKRVNADRVAGNLRINNKGTLCTDKSGTPIKSNTFYGESQV